MRISSFNIVKKLVCFGAIFSTVSTVSGSELNYGQVSMVKQQILKYKKQRVSNKKATALAYKIVRTASQFDLDPVLFSAIIATESQYEVSATNRRTKDYGIAQVSQRNINYYRWDRRRILTDVNYSLRAGATVLAWFMLTYKDKEPRTWFCRYNVGTRKLKGNLARICKRYVNKVWAKL